MSREAMQRVVALGGSLRLGAAMVYRYSVLRPPYFAVSATLVDHAGVVEHETRGAQVTAFRPKNGGPGTTTACT